MNVHKGWAFPRGIYSEVHSPITTPEIICVMALTLQPIRGCPQHSGETGTRFSSAIHKLFLSRFFNEGGETSVHRLPGPEGEAQPSSINQIHRNQRCKLVSPAWLTLPSQERKWYFAIKKLAAISLLYRSLSFRETQKLDYTQKVVNSSKKLIAHSTVYKIEDITWLRGDTKFLFDLLKNISRVSAANTQIMKRRRNFEEKFCISKRPCKVLFII